MSPLFVLCYFIYIAVTTTALSFLLAFRLLLHRLTGIRTSPDVPNIVALYEGTVYHDRRLPIRNKFRFTARYAFLDLDRPPYSPPNFLSADHARRAANTTGPVVAPSLGYERSPVNYYFCYDIEAPDSTKILKKCLVEASNTPWGESVTFVFNPSSDLVPKSEYISPFMDMIGNWRLKVNEPGEHVFAYIGVEHPQLGTYFRSSFTANKLKLPSSSHLTQDDIQAFFWLMPHKISITAYWNAMKLWWKNVGFHEHPRKQNAFYREEAVSMDEKMQFCPIFNAKNKSINDRCFTWKDASKPWSYLIQYTA